MRINHVVSPTKKHKQRMESDDLVAILTSSSPMELDKYLYGHTKNLADTRTLLKKIMPILAYLLHKERE